MCAEISKKNPKWAKSDAFCARTQKIQVNKISKINIASQKADVEETTLVSWKCEGRKSKAVTWKMKVVASATSWRNFVWGIFLVFRRRILHHKRYYLFWRSFKKFLDRALSSTVNYHSNNLQCSEGNPMKRGKSLKIVEFWLPWNFRNRLSFTSIIPRVQ